MERGRSSIVLTGTQFMWSMSSQHGELQFRQNRKDGTVSTTDKGRIQLQSEEGAFYQSITLSKSTRFLLHFKVRQFNIIH